MMPSSGFTSKYLAKAHTMATVWFGKYHKEKDASAIERYWNDKRLEGKEYFVGNKYSFDDIAFLIWQHGILSGNLGQFQDDYDYARDAPNVKAWLDRMYARPNVAKALEEYSEYGVIAPTSWRGKE